MKKVTIFLITATLTLMFFSFLPGCKKNTAVYSCNPKLNDWVTKNMDQYDSISRDSLVLISDLDSQLAIYASLSATHKMNLWIQKLQKVQATYGLSTDENNYIQTAINYFQASYWASNSSLDAFNTWITSWANTGRTNYGWDDYKVYIIAESLMTEAETNTYHYVHTGDPTTINEYFVNIGHGSLNPVNPAPGGPTQEDCNCRYQMSCWMQNTDSHCESNNCGDSYKCGLMSSSRCSGHCVHD